MPPSTVDNPICTQTVGQLLGVDGLVHDLPDRDDVARRLGHDDQASTCCRPSGRGRSHARGISTADRPVFRVGDKP